MNDIEELGYTYGIGSFHPRDRLFASEPAQIVGLASTPKVDRTKIEDSFVIHTYAIINAYLVSGESSLLTRLTGTIRTQHQSSLQARLASRGPLALPDSVTACSGSCPQKCRISQDKPAFIFPFSTGTVSRAFDNSLKVGNRP